jgi:exodeoxyribonuclease VII large subunit
MPDNNASVLSVSAVAKFIQGIIANNLTKLWIRGEVSNLRFQKSGNIFFTLKDEEAKINCLIMHFSNAKKFANNMRDGMEVMVFGKISYYTKEGYITIFIDQIEFLGEGVLQQKFFELKQKLAEEGLFDQSHKKPIPQFPQTVAVITSPTGAAFQDILNVTKRRFQSVNIVIFPASVQGETAPSEISRAIRCADRFAKYIDVMIIGRGGGSLEDLWCFNDEQVARAIYDSKIPVISAVGHEIDFTIADFVADLRAPTPSAAAEIVVKDKKEILNYVQNLRNRVEGIVESKLENIRLILESKGGSNIKRSFQTLISDYSMHLDNLRIRFNSNFHSCLSSIRSRILLQSEKLNALNPKNILARGYSVTFRFDKNGAPVNILSAKEISKGEKIRTMLADGNINSTVD